jgi:hypothetical protein
MDQVAQIIAYEAGELTEDESIALFQDLIDSGLVWSLQGHYGRTAQRLIDAGVCEATHTRALSNPDKEAEQTIGDWKANGDVIVD